MFTCSTLLLFSYPVPADIHGSVQHVTLSNVPVDVLPRLFLWFSQVKHFECHGIRPSQEVQCVHMHSAIVICTLYQSLFDRNWVGAVYGGNCVAQICGGCDPDMWGLWPKYVGAVAQMCGGCGCGAVR